MKKFYFATVDNEKNAKVLTIYQNENLIERLKDFNFVIVHSCSTFGEAVKIVEAWKILK